ncbi:MAG: endo-1,4-beta-xylanase [Phycisphaeraceae bacterium]
MIIDWFRAAHEADPGARLVLNEGGGDGRRGKNLLKLARILVDAKAPISGVGLESHFGWGVPGAQRAYETFDQFAALGLEISITEFDHVISDEQLQADWERDFLTIAFSHPKVTSFTRWGFHNVKGAKRPRGFINPDWTLQPNGQVYVDLNFKQWWTNLAGQTDAQGRFSGRGFAGQYDSLVTHDGQSWNFGPANVPAEGKLEIAVELSERSRLATEAARQQAAKAKAAAIAEVENRLDSRLGQAQ